MRGLVTEFPILTNGGASVGITTGPDNALWFTEIQGNKIGRITTRGHVAEFALPTANARPIYIVRASKQHAVVHRVTGQQYWTLDGPELD